MRRRDFIAVLAGGAVPGSFPLVAHAQQSAMPIIGILSAAPALVAEKRMVSFRQGLAEVGYFEGQNVSMLGLGAEGKFERLPALASDFVRLASTVLAPSCKQSALNCFVNYCHGHNVWESLSIRQVSRIPRPH